jgi:BirA family biotin operon repressor/biotin-[acetyl-CoA-carboxylase] ligase
LFERLAPRFEEMVALWARGQGFPEIRRRWLEGAAGLNGPIRVSGVNGAREGVFQGVDARGRLLLRRGDAIETVESADIFLIGPARAEDPSSSQPLTKA